MASRRLVVDGNGNIRRYNMNPCETCTKECRYKLFINCPIWQEWAREKNIECEDNSLDEEEITLSI